MNALDSLQKVALLLGWVGALVAAAFITLDQSGDATQFFGIADDREQVISFSAAVQVMHYGLMPGQAVTVGDLLVEVRQPEIDAELKVIAEQLRALRSGNREERTSMQSEIVQREADLRASLSSLEAEIRTLRARGAVARALIGSQQNDAGAALSSSGDTSIAQALQNLEEQRQALIRSAGARTGDLRSRLGSVARPVDAQIAELGQRQQELQRRRAEQRVYAKVAGQVGSVLFKIGERVPPYQPVLTVHGTQPSFIKGYIHESVSSDVQLNQTVWIQSASAADATQWHQGEVASLGSRIVEYPVRLKVNPLAQAWGREVMVRLQGEHHLLLGERVHVQLERPDAIGSRITTLLAGVSL